MKRTRYKGIMLRLNGKELELLRESYCGKRMYTKIDGVYVSDHGECYIPLLISYLTAKKPKTTDSIKFLIDLRKLLSEGYQMLTIE